MENYQVINHWNKVTFTGDLPSLTNEFEAELERILGESILLNLGYTLQGLDIDLNEDNFLPQYVIAEAFTSHLGQPYSSNEIDTALILKVLGVKEVKKL